VEQNLELLKSRLIFRAIFELFVGNILAPALARLAEVQKTTASTGATIASSIAPSLLPPDEPATDFSGDSTPAVSGDGLRRSLRRRLPPSTSQADARPLSSGAVLSPAPAEPSPMPPGPSIAPTSDQLHSLVSAFRLQSKLPEFEEDAEMLELLNQFAAIILFAAIFPMASGLAFICNLVEQSADAYKLLHGRRPTARRASGIGAWSAAFEAVAFASALTNAGLLGIQYKSMKNKEGPSADCSTLVSALFATLIFEHALLVVSTFATRLVPDTAESVRDALAIEVEGRRSIRDDIRQRMTLTGSPIRQ
jgi:Calcium-activated chloride channel